MTGASSQLRDVGTVFLLKRPIIVAPGMALGITLLVLSGAPRSQTVAMAMCLGGMFSFFCVEAWYGRRTPVSERWLSWSLRITLAGLTLGCALSGGTRSPFMPLVVAPVVVAFAAFGRGRPSATIATTFAVLICGLAAIPLGWPWPPIPPPFIIGMTAATSIITLILAYVGVAQLSDTLGSSREALLRLREDALLTATDRLASLEAIGAKVSHELKNPLASIKGLAQLSLRGADDERARKRFEVLLTATTHMEEILEEYLSFARPLDSLVLRELDLDALVGDAVDLARTRAETCDIEIACEGVVGSVRGDRQRLLEALLNVLTNAVEASPAGSRVQVSLQRDADMVRIRVHDEGHGLSSADLERLGTPYFTTKADGTGLGVVIAMAGIRQHGGSIEFDSDIEAGTTVSIDLPACPPEEPVPCPT